MESLITDLVAIAAWLLNPTFISFIAVLALLYFSVLFFNYLLEKLRRFHKVATVTLIYTIIVIILTLSAQVMLGFNVVLFVDSLVQPTRLGTLFRGAVVSTMGIIAISLIFLRYPRKVGQAAERGLSAQGLLNTLNTHPSVLGNFCEQKHSLTNLVPEFVLFLNCPEEVMMKRLLNRNQGREDDSIDTIKKRIQVFNDRTLPVIEYYRKMGKVREIDAAKPVEEVFNDIKQCFLPA